MTLRVLAEAEAEANLLEAMRYYEQRQSGLGLNLHDRGDRVTAYTGTQPWHAGY